MRTRVALTGTAVSAIGGVIGCLLSWVSVDLLGVFGDAYAVTQLGEAASRSHSLLEL
jgi:hypothetical protein